MTRILSLNLILIFVFTIVAYGDVTFEMDHIEKSPEEQNKTKAFIKDNRMKMDFYSNGDSPENSMIYRGDKNLMIFVDHGDNSYMVMDKETMQKLSNKLDNAMAQFEDAMKNVPPEQREMMKKMMKDKMPDMGNTNYVEPVLKQSGKASVNGYSCTKYDVYKGKEKVRQHCITNWSNIKGGNEISSVMLEMSDFMDEMTKTFASSSGPFGSSVQFERNVFNQLKEMNGFPVKTVEYEGGKIDSESVFESSSITTLSSSVFEAPSGYKRQNIELN